MLKMKNETHKEHSIRILGKTPSVYCAFFAAYVFLAFTSKSFAETIAWGNAAIWVIIWFVNWRR
jgi:hypothetical protein